ncbi:MAG: phosphoribosylformimino-5-aminoimidazole carboxamide ribotide isomerase [Eubacterium sp.]|nr:phosphoribosylformimino-5-aminoimidazole carboxamide ribotide isomerase [Eubacterium sp.]
MEFRPCIDIHNGKVKQIIGGSLRDAGDAATDNFVSEQDGAFYAGLYHRLGLKGGHIILLNPPSSEYYKATLAQAELALRTWPGGLMLGGGVNETNAEHFLDLGASHVIVTSYVFRNGHIDMDRLTKLVSLVGKEHLVLDLSCRIRADGEGLSSYYVVTDRWQKFTDMKVTADNLKTLTSCCDEFLIHAADVEGKKAGVDSDLIRILAELHDFPVTYAGGVGSYQDLETVKTKGRNHVNVTVGSALDLFGGNLEFQRVLDLCN